jgi:anthranilate phosphoribosyltransferase
MTNLLKSGCGSFIEGDLSLKNLIKKVGKGPKLSQDLTKYEAKAALQQILSPECPPEQVGAFLIAQRIKYETAEETAGFVEALREQTHLTHFSQKPLLELASAHDGKKKSLLLTPFVAMILARHFDINVIVTGAQDVPTKKGLTARAVFEELKIAIHHNSQSLSHHLENQGFAYWDVSDYCPALEALKKLRDHLGLRTALNTCEKIINPVNATHLMTGIFHGPYLLEVAKACLILGYPNVLCAQATEASTDLPLKKRVLYRRVQDGVLSEQLEIDPAQFGLKRDANPEFLEKPSASENNRAVFKALEQREGLVFDALVYNVAVAIWFVGRYSTLEAAIDVAKRKIRL